MLCLNKRILSLTVAVANRRKVRVITVDLKGSLMKNVTAVELLLGVAAFAGNAWARLIFPERLIASIHRTRRLPASRLAHPSR